MAEYFLVMEVPGPAWDHARPRREQDGWDEHAAFVDGLSNEGVVVFGGPLGDAAFGPALLVLPAESEAEIRRRLADGAGMETILTVDSIETCSIGVGNPRG